MGGRLADGDAICGDWLVVTLSAWLADWCGCLRGWLTGREAVCLSGWLVVRLAA